MAPEAQMLYHSIMLNFWKLTFKHFEEVGGATRASALAYQTLLALVPIMVASLAIASALPALHEPTEKFQAYLFEYLLAASASDIQSYVQTFTQQAKGLSAVSLAFLIVSAVMMVSTIEGTLNVVWGVTQKRRGINAFLNYWAVITLLPILAGTALSLSVYVTSNTYFSATVSWLSNYLPLLDFFAAILIWCAFNALYVFLPNCAVRFRDAAVGALIATVLFEIAKRLFGYYAVHLSTYASIYGALSAIPIFLIWLYLSWAIVLYGATVAAVYAKQQKTN